MLATATNYVLFRENLANIFPNINVHSVVTNHFTSRTLLYRNIDINAKGQMHRTTPEVFMQ